MRERERDEELSRLSADDVCASCAGTVERRRREIAQALILGMHSGSASSLQGARHDGSFLIHHCAKTFAQCLPTKESGASWPQSGNAVYLL